MLYCEQINMFEDENIVNEPTNNPPKKHRKHSKKIKFKEKKRIKDEDLEWHDAGEYEYGWPKTPSESSFMPLKKRKKQQTKNERVEIDEL